LAEFLRTHPTTFSQAKDPMDVEDWLKGVEKKLVIAQCTDREKGHSRCTPTLWHNSQLVGDVLQYSCVSTPSPGMSSRLISAPTMCVVAP
jgi:hypothetical protein